MTRPLNDKQRDLLRVMATDQEMELAHRRIFRSLVND